MIFVTRCCCITIVFVILCNLSFCAGVALLTMLSTTSVQSIVDVYYPAGPMKI